MPRIPEDKQKRTSAREKKSGPVFLRVSSQSMTSPHVIDLRQDKDTSALPVFKEKKSKRPERVEVNFSAMVRNSHKKNQKKFHFSHSFLSPTLRPDSIQVEQADTGSAEQEPLFEQEDQSALNQEPVQQQEEAKNGNAFSGFVFFQNLSSKRMILQGIAFLLLFILPFPAFGYYKEVKNNTNHVVSETTTAFLSLQASTLAALQANIPQAQADLNTALRAFSSANAVLEKEHKVLQYVAGLVPVLGAQVESRQHILQAGHHLALGNTYLVQGIQVASQEGQKDLIQKISVLDQHLKSALPQYGEALTLLSRVETSALPAEYQQSFEEFKILFATFIDDMGDLRSLSQTLQTIFGGNDFRRYLVLFQNSHELRPTGGFMGSFAVIDVQKGKLLNIDVPGGGPYDLKGQLSLYLKPPAPVLLSNGRFEFQDANWWAHFPASAKKVSEFYENSRGATVDGVIAVNGEVFEKVLSVLGPIQNEKNNVSLSADTALQTLQYKVEKDFDKEKNTPKEIIGDVLGDLVAGLSTLKAEKALQLLTTLHGSLENKDIQVFMKENSVQNDLRQFGWTGEILSSSSTQDYLMVVQTNLQGQKSDAKIEQTVEHQALVQDDGSVVNTVIVRRKHMGTEGEEFYGAPNMSYMRMYVPLGAELIDAGGFDYPPEDRFKAPEKWYEEDAQVLNLEKELGVHSKTGTRIFEGFGKTIFGNWMITLPGQVTESYVVYKLPFGLALKEQYTKEQSWPGKLLGLNLKQTSAYSLIVQGQSGSNTHLLSSIIYPDGWKPSWVSSRKNINLAQNGAELETDLKKQESFAIIMEKDSP